MRIGPAGLAVLKNLTGLQSLELIGTQVADSEVEELRRALPKAKIHRELLD
jgi:hypothetical protein